MLDDRVRAVLARLEAEEHVELARTFAQYQTLMARLGQIDFGDQIDRAIEMPVKNITTCTFGGPQLTTLFVTTASSQVPGERLGGGLFAMECQVSGQPENRFHNSGVR